MISPSNALKLSAWLYVHQPDLFRQLLINTGKIKASPLGRLGYFGDDASFLDSVATPDLQTVDVSAATADIPMDTSSAIDMAALDANLADTLTADVPVASAIDASPSVANSINAAIGAPGPADSSVPAPSGSFWDSVAAGASSALGAVGKVASALVSPPVLTGAATAAAAYFNSQAKTAQLQAQQAATATQFARVSQGKVPAPITYAVNPQTGQLTPVYASQQGTLPLTAGLSQQLSAPSIGGLPLSTVLIGGGLLLFGVLWAVSSPSNR